MSSEPLFDSAFLRTLDRLVLLTRQAMVGDMQGERRSRRRGSSVEFADFRPYTPGDDIRQLDWNLYARLERLFLKLFVAEEELTVHLLLDGSASMNWGDPDKFDYARRIIGAFGYIVLSGLDMVTATAFGAQRAKSDGAVHALPGVRGKRGAITLFSFLQGLSAGEEGHDLAAMCSRYMRQTRTPGPLILCSDLLDPRWNDALHTLSTRPFEITVVHILAPDEIRPELQGDLRLIDSEGGPSVEITADAMTLSRYHDDLKEWQNEIETFCQARQMTYLFLDTSVPIEEVLVSSMRQRGVLR